MTVTSGDNWWFIKFHNIACGQCTILPRLVAYKSAELLC